MRYPFEPLESFVGAPSVLTFAERLGIDPRQVYRWRERGVTAEQADALAVRAGAISYEIWPQILDDTVAALEQECAAAGCDARWLRADGRGGANRKFCSGRCCSRESMRAYRRTEKGRGANRRYRREVAELQRKRAIA